MVYNGYVINTTQNVYPIGWHVPSVAEWDILAFYLGGTDIAGGKIKFLNLWKSPNSGSTNAYNFSALPSGVRNWDGLFSEFNYIWLVLDFINR